MFDNQIVAKTIDGIKPSHFFRAVNVYLTKPHVVNRKLFGVNQLHSIVYRKPGAEHEPTKDWMYPFINGIKTAVNLGKPFPEAVLEQCALVGFELLDASNHLFDLNNSDSLRSGTGVLNLNRLLPKNLTQFQPLEVVCVLDIDSQSGTFVCIQNEENNLTPKFPFTIQLRGQVLSINSSSVEVSDEKSTNWLKDILFERLLKWIENLLQEPKNPKDDLISLSLINNLEQYNQLYSILKAKYGTEMVRIWPEGTDPKKYVYEDVAIACYLLTLWRQEREETGSDRLQSFVDVGCGNGLLVYILTGEGHPGFGIDLRRRKIWDLYPEHVDLREQAIVPSNAALFPQTDWIIGNHSDEMSPWIPVLAARSSYSCRYFLLPCCAYEFDGSKFQRQNSGVSQYTDFLRYAQQISEVCRFRTSIDRLKIPSTKRTCLVGQGRTNGQNEFEETSKKIETFINERIGESAKTDNESWSSSFKPRESVEPVKNCTKLERNLIDEIVRIVFDALIAKKRIAQEFPEKSWNAGSTIALGDLVKFVPQDKLNALKSECGGLQTLLKNNHQIFMVSGGNVQLRIPTKVGLSSKSAEELRRKSKKQKNIKLVNLKEKPCWFHVNHPDGCPFDEIDCKFKHCPNEVLFR
ncbi:probable tRNA (uracil-O(2)-)-methyltransferase [Uranotaenia lowii]|uniref:probable tRNA (uracil-O(2)-)-methyltransferase n=1 Tax=Uranotaenia lowii TaxID=190385 RepID=UPI0024796715|nr:probable tRNA (uracil-O(2)-)-methyltransferase [Uranotaenia lowii]